MSKVMTIALNTANQQQMARSQHRKRELLRSERQTNHAGAYLGYDADTGTHRLRMEDGGIGYATMTSNGGVRSGQMVNFSRPNGSAIGMIRVMPR